MQDGCYRNVLPFGPANAFREMFLCPEKGEKRQTMMSISETLKTFKCIKKWWRSCLLIVDDAPISRVFNRIQCC